MADSTATHTDQPFPCADARLAEAFALVESDEIAVLSLDVFDTVLWRKVAEPREAFDLIAARLRARGALAPGIDDAEWATLRREAEKRARAEKRDRGEGLEVTLDEIHAAMPTSLLQGSVTREQLCEVECEVERDLLVPDLDILELIRGAHDSGKQVIAVSDTYFSE